MAGLLELMKTKEYADARKKVDGWEARLEKADAKGAMKIGEERSAFFGDMKKKSGGLYALFQMDDKALSERIVKKVTGQDVIID